VNKRTGWITGKPKRKGNYRVVFVAVTSNGSSRKVVVFQIAE